MSQPVKLMTLAPGHFHAALVHKEMPPGVHPKVHIYAPLGPELVAHLDRVARFNHRDERPTGWQLEVHASPDWRERALREQPGHVAVLAGRNCDKIDLLEQCVEAGLHVLADKPLIIRFSDLPRLEAVLAEAAKRELLVSDMMTERFEVTNRLVRDIVARTDLVGPVLAGTADEPAVVIESVHFLRKVVSGLPLRRPIWFFDTAIQGEALPDVGTHLADQVTWLLFPREPIDWRHDVALLTARRWPTPISRDDFVAMTGCDAIPAELPGQRDAAGRLLYACNNGVVYRLRGVHVRLVTTWEIGPPRGGDTNQLMIRCERATVMIRHGDGPGEVPEVSVAAVQAADRPRLRQEMQTVVMALQPRYPGLALIDHGPELHLTVPPALREGHEAHFGRVVELFLRQLLDPRARPTQERSHLLAKSYVTTKGVHLAQESLS